MFIAIDEILGGESLRGQINLDHVAIISQRAGGGSSVTIADPTLSYKESHLAVSTSFDVLARAAKAQLWLTLTAGGHRLLVNPKCISIMRWAPTTTLIHLTNVGEGRKLEVQETFDAVLEQINAAPVQSA